MFKNRTIHRFLVLLLFLSAFVSVYSTSSYGADEGIVTELKEKLVLASKILDMEGLARPMGHISVRIPGRDAFLITRSIAPGMATIDDVVVCNMEGKVIEGKYSRTFGEVMGHVGVYQRRKDIQSVAHTHSPYAIALTMTETTILPASVQALKAGYDPIRLYKKIAMLEIPEVGEEIADMIGSNKVVLLKGHGAVVVGKSIEETTINAIDLEVAAKLQLLASSSGKLVTFTDQEKEPLIKFLKMMEAQGGTASPYGRAWEYYKSILKK
ncbi:MAG TPA: class II aldolase/adducin family protein [Thermodesulfobacteriota bacterium]|nr:class II aldolase/adducin family protein [Thermodesulfobacteriota bacterium]